MKNKSTCTLMTVLLMVLGLMEQKASAANLSFSSENAFNATTSTSLIGSTFAGMNFDEVVNEVNVLARFTPNATNPLTAFRFSGSDSNFGTFLGNVDYFVGPQTDFPDITQDQADGTSYFLQNQSTRIIINPRPFARGPTTAPDYVINTTGGSGITFDEQTGKLLILLYTTANNGGQAIITTTPGSGVIEAVTPIDSSLQIQPDSEIERNPATRNFFVAIGNKIHEIDSNGNPTGAFFASPNGGNVAGMSFNISGDRLFIMEDDGTITRGTVVQSVPSATDLIAALIQRVLELNLQGGISNSLDAKLSAALNALDDLNAQNDVAAVNALQAFISAVQAQSGKAIGVTEADQLIADAQAIIAVLNEAG